MKKESLVRYLFVLVFGFLACEDEDPSESISPRLPKVIQEWHQIFGEEGIRAACSINSKDDEFLLFDPTGKKYAHILNGRLYAVYTNNSIEGPASYCNVHIVDAVDWQDENIYLFDGTSAKYAHRRPNSQCGFVASLSYWGDNYFHPFQESTASSLEGVGAAFQEESGISVHFNRAGDKWIRYFHDSGGPTSNVYSTIDYGPSHHKMPFMTVGAALTFRTELSDIFPDASGIKSVLLFLNKEGSECVFYDNSHGFSEVFPLL